MNRNNSFYPNSDQRLKAFIVKLISKLITLSVSRICIKYSVERIYTQWPILLQIVMVSRGTRLVKNMGPEPLSPKMYSFYCPAQQKLKEIYAIKQPPQEQPQKSQKQVMLQKYIQIDQSIFASYGTHTTNYFASFGIFMHQGCRMWR